MGGYASYVWSAYAITFVVLTANLLYTRYKHRGVLERLMRERKIAMHRSNDDTIDTSGEDRT